MKCICGSSIEPERLAYGLTICKRCAFAGRDQPKYKGMMIFNHKTGGDCQVMSPDDFADHRRLCPYGKNTGRSSGVHVAHKGKPTR